MGSMVLEAPATVHILHIEDDTFQQMSMAAVLKAIEAKNPGSSMQLTCVSSGAEALTAAQTYSDEFDLVLLDYRLPGGNGDTVLPGIRSLVGSLCAIVMLSGEAQEDAMQRCWLDLGADSYRVKPVTAPAVVDLLTYALQKRTYLQKRRRFVAPSIEQSMALRCPGFR